MYHTTASQHLHLSTFTRQYSIINTDNNNFKPSQMHNNSINRCNMIAQTNNRIMQNIIILFFIITTLSVCTQQILARPQQQSQPQISSQSSSQSTQTKTTPSYQQQQLQQQQQSQNFNDLKFEIGENLPNNTLVGFIKSPQGQPPFLILSTHQTREEEIRSALNINHATGEIRTTVVLDREFKDQYSFLAIASNGVEITCTIIVRDVNDNRPTFLPNNKTSFALPEGSKGARRSLPVAIDQDSTQFGIKEYKIVSGNKNDIFKLIQNRTGDMLYVDLEVANGALDRENVSSYQLTIEAIDGGSPPLVGQLVVDITVQDLNDNKPVFKQDRYEGEVKENAIIGTPILQVEAHDPDADQNGQITYHILKRTGHSQQQPTSTTIKSTTSEPTKTYPGHINSDTFDNDIRIENNFLQSPNAPYFGINPDTGKIFLARELDFETEPVHELVIEARDGGVQSLKTYTIVTINVIDVNDNPPTINILFLTENRNPVISESIKTGEVIARVTIEDADSPNAINTQKNLDSNKQQLFPVSLSGADGKFELVSQDPTTYLLIVSGQLDRSSKAVFKLTLTASDGYDYSYASTTTRTIDIHIGDSQAIENSSDRHTPGALNSSISSETLINQMTSGSIFVAIICLFCIFVLTFAYRAKNKQESTYIEAGLALSTNSGQFKGDGSYGSHHHVNGIMSSTNNIPTTNPYQTMYSAHSNHLAPHPYQSINDASMMIVASGGSQLTIGKQPLTHQLPICPHQRSATPTLDKWTNIPGIPVQLVNTVDLTGTYNWDYLSDWTPAYHSVLSPGIS